MIAMAGYYKYTKQVFAKLSIDVDPRYKLKSYQN